ncbi:MAG: glycosyltransferase family 9 protein [Planctomycetota bacterium]
MNDKPREAHRRLRLKNLAIKAIDGAGYAVRRRSIDRDLRDGQRRLREALPDGPASILVIRIASLGDAVRSTAVIAALHERHPDAAIDVLTSPGARIVYRGNPCIRNVLLPEDLSPEASYDWVINLQEAPPPEPFLRDTGVTYAELLERVAALPHRFYSGRKAGEDQRLLIFYCETEVEEHFRNALLDYPATAPLDVRTYFERSAELEERFGFDPGRKRVGIFLGPTSEGSHDGGFRTYPIAYLAELVGALPTDYQVFVVGQSSERTEQEMEQYRSLLDGAPHVVDLVDRTSLEDLLRLLGGFDAFVSCDSGPLHFAMGQRTPVVALMGNRGSFSLLPVQRSPRLIWLNSFEPCFALNWRWKFFCSSCQDRHYEMYGCDLREYENILARLPIPPVVAALAELLAGAPERR